ncbi:MAG: aminopeptidase P N-terminal domain-containing protein [Pseudobdellovibrionaceae bacterium]
MSRKPLENIQLFLNRRLKLREKIKGAALVLFSHPEQLRNNDVHHPYRADSNFYYLTGFEEPESVFIFRPNQKPESILFVRKKDKVRETWDGFRYGPEEAQKVFAVDAAYLVDDVVKEAAVLLKDMDTIYHSLFKNPEADKLLSDILATAKAQTGRSGRSTPSILSSDAILAELRIIKTDADIANLRTACDITSKAHDEAMKYTRPGLNEKEIQGWMQYQFLKNGAAREGYNFIVAGGNNATTLHYNFNDQVCKNGDLLLIDAGAEYNYFTSDITRTFPISGKFSVEQAKIYQGVLDVQKKIIALIKPGVPYSSLQEQTIDSLVDFLLELGFFTGRKADVISSLEYKKYYPHGISHWLGMDVHDTGLYIKNGSSILLEEGMCLTVEPGLYFPIDDTSIPEKYRGIGVRIEDDILVTKTGCEVLTTAAKEISAIEKLMS